jgi:hypothetical protein
MSDFPKTYAEAKELHENREEPELTPFQRVLGSMISWYGRYDDEDAERLCSRASAIVARMDPDDE